MLTKRIAFALEAPRRVWRCQVRSGDRVVATSGSFVENARKYRRMDDMREIDLAGRSASRVVWTGRLVVRFWQIAFWLTVTIAALPNRVVAVKVRRPGIVRRAYLDESILRFVARVISWAPSFALLSPVEAVGEFCSAVNKQLDFRIEAENNRRFRENFQDDPQVV